MQQKHNTGDGITVTLDEDIAVGETDWTLETGDGAVLDAIGYPLWLVVNEEGGEQIEVTSMAGDVATVVRAQNGTAASIHFDGDICYLWNVAAKPQEFDSIIDVLMEMLAISWGGGDGVVQYGNLLAVTAQGVPDMTVNVDTGYGFANLNVVKLAAAFDTAVMVAPTGNPRIDLVQISPYDVVTVKTGAEAGAPVAPTVDANNTALAEIFHRVGTVHIDDVDDTTNSYITDVRVFL